MFFVALAVDYDGTLARDGRVNSATIDALEKVKNSGRKLILVTGRDLTDLRRVFADIAIFDLVVAENGALLFDPAQKKEDPLAPAPQRSIRRSIANSQRLAPVCGTFHRRDMGTE